MPSKAVAPQTEPWLIWLNRNYRLLPSINWFHVYFFIVIIVTTVYFRTSHIRSRDASAFDLGQGVAQPGVGEIHGLVVNPVDPARRRAVFAPLFTKKKLVIWSNDFYTSPIYDLKHLLSPLGVRFIDKSLSDTCHRTRTCGYDLKVLNKENAVHLTPAVTRQFYNAYKDDPEIQAVDAFVCFYPVSMCEVFVPFNKTIIIITSHRYELGREEAIMWRDWNQKLIQISKDPKNLVAANNLYDAEYIRYFTGISPALLPSFCGYISVKYHPVRAGFILTAGRDRRLWHSFTTQFNTACEKMNCSTEVVPLRRRYKTYSYKDLASHQGIIHVPHQVTAMSLFEQYRMNIPLFFPSLDLLANWHMKYMLVAERTLIGGKGGRSEYSKVQPHNPKLKIPNPLNERDITAIRYWLKMSDFYQMPYITYYDSFEDLVVKLETTNLRQISLRMEWHNEVFKEELVEKWKKILLAVAHFSVNKPR